MPLTLGLLEWMHELDGELPQHKCALICSPDVSPDDEKAIVAAARLVFKSLDLLKVKPFDDVGWPESCNHLFRVGLRYAKQKNSPFFWIEPDVTPLKKGWVDAFAGEYDRARKPYLGYVHNIPFDHITGVAIYPPDIEKYNPECLKVKRTAGGQIMSWDTIAPALTMKHAHSTRLIHHQYWKGDVVGSTPPTFPGVDSLKMLRPDAVLFHRCKDGSLIKRLREAGKREKNSKTFLDRLKRIVKPAKPDARLFFNSGDLGDIIYSLPTVKGLGGGVFRVGPLDSAYRMPTREPMNGQKAEFLRALIASQPYIKGFEFGPHDDNVNVNLNSWRSGRWPVAGRSLSSHQRIMNGLDAGDETVPWIEVTPSPHCNWPIVISRSERYLNTRFPWGKLVKQFGEFMVFVGLHEEHKIFCQQFGRVQRVDVGTALEMAAVIASGRVFIGNQSLAYSIAEGMKVNTVQETFTRQPDCTFSRPNARYGTHPDIAFIEDCIARPAGTTRDVLPACIFASNYDREKVARLAEHCERLDGTKLVIFTDPAVNSLKQPTAGNYAFQHVLDKMAGRAFIWMESDCIPFKAGWSEALTAAYHDSGKDFVLSSDQNPPGDMIGGIGVYGVRAREVIPKSLKPPNTRWGAWDGWLIDHASHLLHRTPLIQHSYAVYDTEGHLRDYHRFPRDAGILRPDALMFHADKNQDLLNSENRKI